MIFGSICLGIEAASVGWRDLVGTLNSGGKAAGSVTQQDAEAGILISDTRFAPRRLMPIEYERLQGFPDNYTRIPVRVRHRSPSHRQLTKFPDLFERLFGQLWIKYADDGPRYRALGNSMAVPCIRWLGQRIALVDALISKNHYPLNGLK